MPIRWIKTNEPWMEESIKYRVTIEHELRRYVVVVVDADTFAQWFAINITRWTQPQWFRLKNDVHRDVKPQTEWNRDERRIFGRIFLESSMKTFERVLEKPLRSSHRQVSRAGWNTIAKMNESSISLLHSRTFTLESSTKKLVSRSISLLHEPTSSSPTITACTCEMRSQTRKKKPQANLAQKPREKEKNKEH